ncbi:saccharopine dehydrogenase [Pelomyxa schiedti]|nr:saccharopine dehydrogenase [Pelomyxa schiedti]
MNDLRSAAVRRVDNLVGHITASPLNSVKKTVLVLGGGLVGGVLAGDLSTDDDIVVTVADASPAALARLKTAYPRLNTIKLDLSDKAAIIKAVGPFDMVVGALPSWLGFNALSAVVEANKNYVDISFMEQDYTQLDSIAKAKGTVVVCDCGVGPGMSHMMCAYGSKFFVPDGCEDCIIYIGGVPLYPKPPFNYKVPFCPHDVFAEYTRDSTVVRNGKVLRVPALTELETILLPMVPEGKPMEAFITDGLRSLTQKPIAKNMCEKTLRWPGYHNFVLSLKDAGFFGMDPIKITSTGQTIVPDAVTSQLLLPHWKQNLDTDPECTVMRVQLTGIGNERSGAPGKRCRITFDLFVSTDISRPVRRSSMAVSTGCTCALVARMVLHGQYAVPGVHPPEVIGFQDNLFEQYTQGMASRDVYPEVADDQHEPSCCGKCWGNRFVGLIVLCLLQLFAMIDRALPSSMKDTIKEDLDLSDFQTGVIFTGFVIVNVVASTFFGHLVDKGFSRKLLLSCGMVAWSIAACCTALCNNFVQLMIPRAIVGVGEASLAAVLPPLICDYFPPHQVSKALSTTYTMIPVGTALSYVLGGYLSGIIGWRLAFVVSGAPGIMVFAVLLLKTPVKGNYEDAAAKKSTPPGGIEGLKILLTTPSWVALLIGRLGTAFCTGAMTDWLPTYFLRTFNLEEGQVGLIVGFIVLCGGFLGTICGSLIGDFARRCMRQPYFFVSFLAAFLTASLVTTYLLLENKWVSLSFAFVATICLFLALGPLGAILNNCVAANLRGRANSYEALFVCILGASYSSAAVGAVSDATGNVAYGLLLVPCMLLIPIVVWCIAWLFIKQDTSGETYREKTEAEKKDTKRNELTGLVSEH